MDSNHSPTRATAPAPAGLPAPLAGPDLALESELFWEKYKLPIAALAVLLIVGLLGFELYEMSHSRSVAAASAELNAARTVADYQKVIDAHSGSPAAANAYLLMARKQAEDKDFASAEKSFRTFAEKFPKHKLAPNALMGAAGALESRGMLDQARATYQDAAARYQNSYTAPLALLAEATVLKAQRKIEEARRIYENVVATYSKTDASQEATQELRYLHALPPLGAKPPAPAEPAVTPAPAADMPPPAVAVPPPAAAVPPVPAVEPTLAPSPAPATSPVAPAN